MSLAVPATWLRLIALQWPLQLMTVATTASERQTYLYAASSAFPTAELGLFMVQTRDAVDVFGRDLERIDAKHVGSTLSHARPPGTILLRSSRGAMNTGRHGGPRGRWVICGAAHLRLRGLLPAAPPESTEIGAKVSS